MFGRCLPFTVAQVDKRWNDEDACTRSCTQSIASNAIYRDTQSRETYSDTSSIAQLRHSTSPGVGNNLGHIVLFLYITFAVG